MFLHSVLYISVSNGFFFSLSYLVIDLHAFFFSPINLNYLVACHTQFSLNGFSFCIASFFFIVGLYFLRLYIVQARVFFSW